MWRQKQAISSGTCRECYDDGPRHWRYIRAPVVCPVQQWRCVSDRASTPAYCLFSTASILSKPLRAPLSTFPDASAVSSGMERAFWHLRPPRLFASLPCRNITARYAAKIRRSLGVTQSYSCSLGTDFRLPPRNARGSWHDFVPLANQVPPVLLWA